MSTSHLTDEHLSAHIDAALDAESSAAVASHLQDCAECGARLERLRATSQAVASLPPQELPRPLDLAFLREGAGKPRHGFFPRVIHGRPPVWLPTAVAAAAVLVLAVTVAPRFLPTAGGLSTTSGGGAAQSIARGAPRAYAPQDRGVAPGYSSPAPGAALNSLGGAALQKAARGADGSGLSVFASPSSAPAGHPTQVTLELVAGPSGTSLTAQGMELLVGQGSQQVRLAASQGASRHLNPGERLELTADWSAGALSGPPAPGAYSLIGRVSLAGGQTVEIELPFSVGSP